MIKKLDLFEPINSMMAMRGKLREELFLLSPRPLH